MSITNRLASLFLFAATAAPGLTQDVVTLHSVDIDAGNQVTVVYSKNFVTCAHMRFSNATCTQTGALTHVNNWFCTMGNQVSVTLPLSAFVAGFGHGVPVYMVHGNNGGVASPCVTVGCTGRYGAGCPGTAGAPQLTAASDCPAAPGTDLFTIGNGPSGSLAVLGFGFGQASAPLLGCTLLVANVIVTVTVPLDGSGSGSFPLALPPSSAGVNLTTQAYVLDAGGPQGFAATNGLLIRVL